IGPLMSRSSAVITTLPPLWPIPVTERRPPAAWVYWMPPEVVFVALRLLTRLLVPLSAVPGEELVVRAFAAILLALASLMLPPALRLTLPSVRIAVPIPLAALSAMFPAAVNEMLPPSKVAVDWPTPAPT